MYFFALATDYDGTLATDGQVPEATLSALEDLRRSGRRLIMVTGRELDDLRTVFDRFDLFDMVVAENGALLYLPGENREIPLADPPPPAFAERLRARGVSRLSVGRVIVATWEPHQQDVIEVIRELGLELHVIFNKGAVMVLPTGVNKATGLKAALDRLGLSAHNLVGAGDAENDHSFLIECGCAVAVANALPTLKDEVDLVTRGARSIGMAELAERLVEDDLASAELRSARQEVPLGDDQQGRTIGLSARGGGVLVAGSSGSGKSTLALGLIERMVGKGYQVCALDPEGDYEGVLDLVPVGGQDHPPDLDRVRELLARPGRSIAPSLLGIPMEDRPRLFAALLHRIQEVRSRGGHPHWVVADEAHHLVPADWRPADLALPRRAAGMVFLTLRPESLAAEVLREIETLLVVGDDPADTFRKFGEAAGVAVPPVAPSAVAKGKAWFWRRGEDSARLVSIIPPVAVRHRHRRKYAAGQLSEDDSFHFRGADGRLNLKAHNLQAFIQIAAGIDDDTWRHHLRQGDYSRWFRDSIKDQELAREAELAAGDDAESRRLIIEAIERRYCGPA